ncbi:hypothetical protein SAMN05421823_103663 [Catalinimonas alkaloidigena]|uniref:Lipoprotein n=1 Tax=Catalinimonas alkaloidigena TaxID=1075417 RepID=A0A1G9F3N8_9BACT|nr:hypothetical protein [Catalinimonas alkaloidigena]SDK82950.1 hypothetical protein SAMN05421823_103663 [Catalinimonas alkaloidigena]
MSRSLLFLLILTIGGCASKNQSNVPAEPELVDTVVFEEEPAPTVPSVSKTELIFLPDTATTFRGLNLGASRQEVLQMEADNAPEERTDRLLVSLDLDSTELADIMYILDENDQVKGFNIQVYLRNESSLRDMQTELQAYFTQKYGAPRAKQNDYVEWSLPEQEAVRMGIINEGIDKGIEIEIGAGS